MRKTKTTDPINIFNFGVTIGSNQENLTNSGYNSAGFLFFRLHHILFVVTE